MAFYDIFNGDADGICALHQLRLSEPRRAELVTGTKREIRLVARCAPASGDEMTVLDGKRYIVDHGSNAVSLGQASQLD